MLLTLSQLSSTTTIVTFMTLVRRCVFLAGQTVFCSSQTNARFCTMDGERLDFQITDLFLVFLSVASKKSTSNLEIKFWQSKYKKYRRTK